MTWLVLIGAVLALVLWFGLTFVVPVGVGIVHVLLALGVLWLICWWVLRTASPGPSR
jgi:hypothetical protein